GRVRRGPVRPVRLAGPLAGLPGAVQQGTDRGGLGEDREGGGVGVAGRLPVQGGELRCVRQRGDDAVVDAVGGRHRGGLAQAGGGQVGGQEHVGEEVVGEVAGVAGAGVAGGELGGQFPQGGGLRVD